MLSTSYQSPKFSLTSVLPHSRSVRLPTLRQVVSTWTRCGGRLAPRRANERYTAEPTTLAQLAEALETASYPGLVRQRLRRYTTPSVLIIDEVGYTKLSPGQAHHFFELVTPRYS